MWTAVAALVAVVGGCATGGDIADREQPYPVNHRTELLAFFRTYLNNPVGVREAMLADPVQRTIGGRVRYVACVRYKVRDDAGQYRAAAERGVLFVDGRLDRVLEASADACAGAVYAPFPELEKLTR